MTDPSKQTGFPKVNFSDSVLRNIRRHGKTSMHAEICGVLIGREVEGGTQVTACIAGDQAAERGASVTFTQETWEHIYKVKDEKYPDDAMVGWYHTHPGFGIFLSNMDIFIHENFFSAPHQIAWVYDPQSEEEGCFGWKDKEIRRLPQTSISFDDRPTGEPPSYEPLSLSAPTSSDPSPSSGEKEEEREAEDDTKASTPEEPEDKKQKYHFLIEILIALSFCSLGLIVGYLIWGAGGDPSPQSVDSSHVEVVGTRLVKNEKLQVRMRIKDTLLGFQKQGTDDTQPLPAVQMVPSQNGFQLEVRAATLTPLHKKIRLPLVGIPDEAIKRIKETSWKYSESPPDSKDIFLFSFELEPTPPSPSGKNKKGKDGKEGGSSGGKGNKHKPASLPMETREDGGPVPSETSTLPLASPVSPSLPSTVVESNSSPIGEEGNAEEGEVLPSDAASETIDQKSEPEIEEDAGGESDLVTPEKQEP